MSLSEDELVEFSDTAAARSLFTMMVEPKAGGGPIDMVGRYRDATRNFGSHWLYIADHASVPVPGDE